MSLGTGRNKINTFVANCCYCTKDPTQDFQNTKMKKKKKILQRSKAQQCVGQRIAHCVQICKFLRQFLRRLF
jgi:hypothetical protein